MASIRVEHIQGDVYRVTVDDEGGTTIHEVTARKADVERYAPGVAPERLIEASFAFLLEREPKEAILSRFDLPVIQRYFPEYPRRIVEKL